MAKITSLTPGQEKRLTAVYEEWLAVGRNCAPLDRPQAAEIIDGFYSRIGKPKPTVLFFSSPLMCVLAHGAITALTKKNPGQLWGQLRGQLSNYCGGQHWCAWEVFYAFCGEIGARYTADQAALLDLWLRQSKGLHWWFPYEGIVLASERHTLVHVDEQGRLHHARELACGYGDGWGVHAWHGTRIPDSYFDKEPTGSEILAERNAEVRRCLIERHDELNGKGSFMRVCGATVLDSAVQPMHVGGKPMLNELLAIELPEDPERRMVALRVICPSTQHEYIIRTPPDMKTVRQALAWTFDVKPSEYLLAQET